MISRHDSDRRTFLSSVLVNFLVLVLAFSTLTGCATSSVTAAEQAVDERAAESNVARRALMIGTILVLGAYAIHEARDGARSAVRQGP